MTTRRHFIQATTGAAALSLLGLQPAAAQALELVKIINGFPVGGSADATSRRIGEKLGPSAYCKNQRWSKTKPVLLPASR